jgi:hypothetical protein
MVYVIIRLCDLGLFMGVVAGVAGVAVAGRGGWGPVPWRLVFRLCKKTRVRYEIKEKKSKVFGR